MKLHEYMTYNNTFRGNSILAVNIENFENSEEENTFTILRKRKEKNVTSESTYTHNFNERNVARNDL